MAERKRDNNLSWKPKPTGTYVITEMIQSDAWRSLSKAESDIWLFVLSRRKFPKSKKINFWEPTNGRHIKLPTVAIRDFFDGEVRDMNRTPPNPDTIRKAFRKYMEAGFLSLKYLGGNGKGDQNIYQLEHDWRTWKKGDPPCYTKAGMSRAKGCCVPGSGKFYESGSN